MIATGFEKMAAEWEKARGEWEKAASTWWDRTLRDPGTLGTMGDALRALAAAKERSDEALERALSAWRLPTAGDVIRLHDRLGAIEERLAGIEERLGIATTREAAARPAAAGESTDAVKETGLGREEAK